MKTFIDKHNIRYSKPTFKLTLKLIISLVNWYSGMNQLWKEQCNIVGCNLNASLDKDYRASCVQGIINLLALEP